MGWWWQRTAYTEDVSISVLGIAGGIRSGGNSETLLERALAGARDAGADTEFVRLRDHSIGPCICPQSEDCLLTGVCTVLDDMQPLYARLRSVDAIIIAFPIAFRSVPAQTKALYDRTQPLWVRKYVMQQNLRESEEPGRALIISVADRDAPAEFDGALQATRSWLVSMHFRETERLLVHGLVRPGDVLARPEVLTAAYEHGARLVAGGAR